MPPYARSFCEALAKYMREVLPITQPSVGKSAAARNSPQNRALRNARPGTREAPERCPGGPNSYDLLWALGPGTPPLRIRGGVFLWAPRVHTAPHLQS